MTRDTLENAVKLVTFKERMEARYARAECHYDEDGEPTTVSILGYGSCFTVALTSETNRVFCTWKEQGKALQTAIMAMEEALALFDRVTVGHTIASNPAAYMQCLLGEQVVIRDNMHGVYAGTLVAIELNEKTWALANARQAHMWTGAAATPGLAVRGPGNKPEERIGPFVPLQAGAHLVSVLSMTPEAWQVWEKSPVWMDQEE